MVSAQEWLNKNYPKDGVCQINDGQGLLSFIFNNKGKKRSQIKWLNFSQTLPRQKSRFIKGCLNLSDFVNLEKFECSDNQLTQLILPVGNNLLSLVFDDNNVIDIENLDRHPDLKEINCSRNKLTSLDLTGNFSLQQLNCSGNNLIDIKLPNCNKLEKVDISYNKIIHFEFLALNPETLTELNLSNFWDSDSNYLDIKILKELVNLVSLNISGFSRPFLKEGNFFGSLESLKMMKKLAFLNISDTNIDRGLEFLPDSLENFYCKHSPIFTILKFYEGNKIGRCRENHVYNLNSWRQAHQNLVNNAQIINSWEQDGKTVDLLIEEIRSENEQYYQNIEIAPKC